MKMIFIFINKTLMI